MIAYKAYGPDGAGFFRDYVTAFKAVAGEEPGEVESEDDYRQLLSIIETGDDSIETIVTSAASMIHAEDLFGEAVADTVLEHGGAEVRIEVLPYDMPAMGQEVETPDGRGTVKHPTTDPSVVLVTVAGGVRCYDRDELKWGDD